MIKALSSQSKIRIRSFILLKSLEGSYCSSGSEVFLQVLQGLLVHLIISDTYFPFLLSSTIKSFMAGGVRLLILNKKSIEQTMNDYITNELARAK